MKRNFLLAGIPVLFIFEFRSYQTPDLLLNAYQPDFDAMLISATYICPVRGLGGLKPPEPVRLGQAAGVAKALGIERFLLPVLEESLQGTSRAKIMYLDGLVLALDKVTEARLTVWVIAPSQRVLGLDMVPPYLVRGGVDPNASPVFVDGRIRNLRPFNWWADPSLIQKRIKCFRELLAAVHDHPAIGGWLVFDRALEWSRPGLEVADLVLKSYLAEIRERDESGKIYLSLGWSELLDPQMVQALVGQVDGLRMGGLENQIPGLDKPVDLAGELLMTAYLGTISHWLFGKPIDVEVGWSIPDRAGDPEKIAEAGKRLANQGLAGAVWLSLIDPEAGLYTHPPWALQPGLKRVGLLDQHMEPKEHVEICLNEMVKSEAGKGTTDFIEISPEEYGEDPRIHLFRLWEHFRESS